MKMIINKVIGKIFGKSRKFFPVVNKQGKAKKFYPITECEYLLTMRKKGITGNGRCTDNEF